MKGIIKPVLAMCLFFYLGIMEEFEQCFQLEPPYEPEGLDNSDCLEYIKKIRNGEDIDVKILGRKTFGLVSGCELSVDNKKYKIAMKIMKYSSSNYKENNNFFHFQEVKVEDIKQELNVLEALYSESPLYIPDYYCCVHDKERSAVYIFQERYDQTLGEYITKLTSVDEESPFPPLGEENFETTVGIMLQMAIAVKLIHEKGFGHFNLNPSAFMVLQKGLSLIAKPIGFGLSLPLNNDVEKIGNINYIDPLWMNKNPSVTSQIDVYSLGLTYMGMLYGLKYVNLGLKRPPSLESYNKKFKKRQKKQQKLFGQVLNPDNKPNHPQQLYHDKEKLINNVTEKIKAMLSEENRATLDDVISSFITILRMKNEKSIYLPENAKVLYESVYGTDRIEDLTDVLPYFLTKVLAKDDLKAIYKKLNPSVDKATVHLSKGGKRII